MEVCPCLSTRVPLATTVSKSAVSHCSGCTKPLQYSILDKTRSLARPSAKACPIDTAWSSSMGA